MAPAGHHSHGHQHRHQHQREQNADLVAHGDATSVYEAAVTATRCSDLVAPPLVVDSLLSPSLAPTTIPSTTPRPSPHTKPPNHPTTPSLPNSFHAHTMQPKPHAQIQPFRMPPWLTLLILTIILVAATWTLLTCAIHQRGATTGMSLTQKSSKTSNALWARITRWTPFAEARYVALRSEEAYEGCTDAVSSASHVQHRSPLNPYLIPPSERPLRRTGRVRSEGEWKEEHRAFFLHGAVGSSVAKTAMAEDEMGDVEAEAREAQGRGMSVGRDLKSQDGRGEFRKSWVDMGLVMVDGAVDRAAARIVRWTADGGRDEDLVLPLAKRKTD